MKLYHGTDTEFIQPILDQCLPYKDFGKGFYLANKLPMAKNWAAKKNQLNNRLIVNVYHLNDEFREVDGLNIKEFVVADEEWIRFVYNNRMKRDFSHDYDIVIGPIADNRLPHLFAAVKRKEKTFAQIVEEARYKRFRGIQYCFNTQRAINLLRYDQRRIINNNMR